MVSNHSYCGVRIELVIGFLPYPGMIWIPGNVLDERAQRPEIKFNEILNTIHKNYMGLTSMLQGFQKCIASNPSK